MCRPPASQKNFIQRWNMGLILMLDTKEFLMIFIQNLIFCFTFSQQSRIFINSIFTYKISNFDLISLNFVLFIFNLHFIWIFFCFFYISCIQNRRTFALASAYYNRTRTITKQNWLHHGVVYLMDSKCRQPMGGEFSQLYNINAQGSQRTHTTSTDVPHQTINQPTNSPWHVSQGGSTTTPWKRNSHCLPLSMGPI